jgi:hypothetical protein
MRKPKKQKKPLNDLTRSLTPFEPNQTLTAVVELSNAVLVGVVDHIRGGQLQWQLHVCGRERSQQ